MPTIQTHNEIGKEIEARRNAAHLTQQQLADLAGISRKPILMVEAGDRPIKTDTLLRILDVLGLSIAIVPKGSHEG